MRIYIDGTWNNKDSGTNVWKMHQRFGGQYFAGVGTKVNKTYRLFPALLTKLDKLVGGITGWGTEAIVDKAYARIVTLKGPKEPIDIFGYSRGGAAARMLAARLAKDNIPVRFLGIFDTVGAFGIPMNFWPFSWVGINFQEINLFTDMKVHTNVRYARHARACVVKYNALKSTPMELRKGIDERWFDGDHVYVGHGDIPYEWMIKEYLTLGKRK